MELKAPTPLGGGEIKQETTKIEPPVRKERGSFLAKIKLPTIQLPKLNIPKVNIPWLKLNLSPEKKRKILEISLITVPSILLIVLFISIFSYVKSEPYRISREFLQRIENRNTNGAYSMTTDAYQAVYPVKEFRKVADRLNGVDLSNPKVKSKRIEEIPGMGKYAYITYKISGYYVDITVFNDTIDWGIHSISIDTKD